MSFESPETPSRPDALFSFCMTSSALHPSAFFMCTMMEGSMEPLRVSMTTPSSGVSPIVVSMLWPFRTAQSEQPLPRWAVTMA